MARQNGISTYKLQMTIDGTTDRIIAEMVGLGIHGANKSEVGCSIIRQWLWDNQDKLRANGIDMAQPKKKG